MEVHSVVHMGKIISDFLLSSKHNLLFEIIIIIIIIIIIMPLRLHVSTHSLGSSSGQHK
jgi:hypothetical protein